MHWIKLIDKEGLFMDLGTGTQVVVYSDGSLRFIFTNGDWRDVDEVNAPLVIARLDALAEIATHRTANALPALNEEE